MSFWVYMLRCRDGSYYIGHTGDIENALPSITPEPSTATRRCDCRFVSFTPKSAATASLRWSGSGS